MNMRGFYILLSLALLIISCRAQTKTSVPPKNNSAAPESIPIAVKTASKIKFSSVYTKLDSKICKPISKAESEEDEIPLICEGYNGYKIFLGEHGQNPPMYIGRKISTDLDAWNPSDYPSFNGAEMGQTIEWRLAVGEPFAFIIHAEYDKQDCDTDEKGKVNNLVVQNLRGFAPISISIDVTKNKRANQEARQRADAGYRKL